MLSRRRSIICAPFLFLFLACSQSSAQSPKDVDAMRKELDALKAQQTEMQKSLDEIRDFLKAATGGRFGAPTLVNSTFDISGAQARGDVKAPVTLIELSDYHCPFCRRHVQQTQPRIYSELVTRASCGTSSCTTRSRSCTQTPTSRMKRRSAPTTRGNSGICTPGCS